MLKPYYEIISFSCEPNEITESIIREIESQKIYFDYHLTREHSILYGNTLVKDISLIGRDPSKIIIIDDDKNCFQLNNENGIKISEFNGNNDNDNSLFELKKILILIYRKNYDDVRLGIKEFANEIKSKVSLL
jgi:TFIIF-interacting CTD phosphatase-like protein